MKERHLENRRRARFDRRSGKERRRSAGRSMPFSADDGAKDRRNRERRCGTDRRVTSTTDTAR
jgi:hypothetical protein